MLSSSETLAGYTFFDLAVKAKQDEEDNVIAEYFRNVTRLGVSCACPEATFCLYEKRPQKSMLSRWRECRLRFHRSSGHLPEEEEEEKLSAE